MHNLRFQILRKGIKIIACQRNHPKCFSTSVIRPKRQDIKTAVLMIYTGGPKCYEEIPCFIQRLMTDKNLSYCKFDKDERMKDAEVFLKSTEKKYAKVDNRSPIILWTRPQSKMLERRLDVLCTSTEPHKTFVAYQFVKPSIYDALTEIDRIKSLQNILILPMYPQYSCGLTGGCYNSIFKYYKERAGDKRILNIKWYVVDSWATPHSLIKTHALNISKEIMRCKIKEAIIIFVGCPMPSQATIFGDFYPYLVGSTMMHVMKFLRYSLPYTLAWHSSLANYKWYQPLVSDVVSNYARNHGKQNFILVPITSVTENLITKYDFDIDIMANLAPKLGKKVKVFRVTAPNNENLFIHALVDVCKEAFLNPWRLPRRLTERCPLCTNQECIAYKSWFRGLILKDKSEVQVPCAD